MTTQAPVDWVREKVLCEWHNIQCTWRQAEKMIRQVPRTSTWSHVPEVARATTSLSRGTNPNLTTGKGKIKHTTGKSKNNGKSKYNNDNNHKACNVHWRCVVGNGRHEKTYPDSIATKPTRLSSACHVLVTARVTSLLTSATHTLLTTATCIVTTTR